jgi:superfamily II DNA/RNA helicase
LKFIELKLDSSLQEGIESLGFDSPTPIQEKAIPLILEGKDLIGSAQTGTGKTAAFLIPLIQKILEGNTIGSLKAMIIVPTRELAVQIDQQMEGISYFTGLSSMAIYGGGDGTSFAQEKQALTEGADLVICTPGRMISHLNAEYVKIDKLTYLILDEADRMLDMGFFEDLMKIINYLPKKRQTLMFSATMPVMIRKMARKILNNPVEINIAMSKPAEKILQLAYVLFNNQKISLITYLLKNNKGKSILIFCSTKSSTKDLSRALNQANLVASEIHSDLDQKERERVLLSFKNKELNILVATDILSRGIDIEDIDLIINYDVPNDGEDYIHRIGRTARAEAEGVAITLINEKDQSRFYQIEKLLEKTVHKALVPAHLGKTPVYNPNRKNKPKYKRSFKKGKKLFNKKKKT